MSLPADNAFFWTDTNDGGSVYRVRWFALSSSFNQTDEPIDFFYISKRSDLFSAKSAWTER
jgi:hypothetical protein